MPYNGPAVWLVGGSLPRLKRGVAVPRFLPVPVDGRAPTGHDEAVLTVPSPGDGC